MSSTSASAARRRGAAQRRRGVVARRRRRVRRVVRGLAALAALVAIVVIVVPAFETAYEHLTLPLAYPGVIVQQAREKHLDPAFVAAVIYAETKFDARTSPTGAEGLMQIEPATAEFLAHRSGATTFHIADLGDPAVNIAYGSYYLRYLLDLYRGNKMLALAAYNAGETNVDAWLTRAREQGSTLTVGDIPFAETRDYVERVLSARQRYRHAYPRELGYP